jgi:hypothetical protein
VTDAPLARILRNHDWAAQAERIERELARERSAKRREFLQACLRIARNQAARK